MRLDDEAARGWDRVTEQWGISKTALAEALGQMIAQGSWRPPEEAVTLARKIDRDRRRR